jgi:SAM-dependent methyltransferase
MTTKTIRALLSWTLARRFAWILFVRLQCGMQVVRGWRRHRTYVGQLAKIRARTPARDVRPDRLFTGVEDDFWYWLIGQSYADRQAFDGVLPGFPDEAVQVRTTGSSGQIMLWQTYCDYRMFRTLAAAHGRAIPSCRAVLDFGCGWGRLARFFLKDIPGDRLWGIDPNPDAVDICRRNNRWSRFEVVNPFGPTDFPGGTFDLVYSFSVFSHFSEEMHFRWLEEIQRILQPGGVFMATTRPRDFIEQSVLDRLRRPFTRYPEAIAGMFRETPRWLTAYDDGHYCYEPHPGKVWWGETCIPRAYVLRHWTKYFDILDYVDDPRRCPQSVIVARRRAESGA